jgi:hypothetical protein
MLKLCEEPKQGTVCWRHVLAVPWTVKLGLTKAEYQAKPLIYIEKVVFHTNLEQMFKHMATNWIHSQPCSRD